MNLSPELRAHADKGDPRDVAAYCAFLWYHGASSALSGERAATTKGLEGEADTTRLDWLEKHGHVAAKYRANAEIGGSTADIAGQIAALWALDQAPSVTPLMALLRSV